MALYYKNKLIAGSTINLEISVKDEVSSSDKQLIAYIRINNVDYPIYCPSSATVPTISVDNSFCDQQLIATITVGSNSTPIYAPTQSISSINILSKTSSDVPIADIFINGVCTTLYSPPTTSSGGISSIKSAVGSPITVQQNNKEVLLNYDTTNYKCVISYTEDTSDMFGYRWCREWSDGWLELGGRLVIKSHQIDKNARILYVKFLQEFNNKDTTTITTTLSSKRNFSNWGYWFTGDIIDTITYPLTTQGFYFYARYINRTLWDDSTYMMWEAKGFKKQ